MYHKCCPNCGAEFETREEFRWHTSSRCGEPQTPLVLPRALTLRQPWATLVAKGLKTYETRSWAPSYRGPLLIHAGASVDKDFTAALVGDGVLTQEDLPAGRAAPWGMPTMAILCVVDLWECHRTPGRFPADEYTYGDFSPGRWAWELRNLRVLSLRYPVKGKLGLWLPSVEDTACINARLFHDRGAEEMRKRESERQFRQFASRYQQQEET